jgi:hypothetical protein
VEPQPPAPHRTPVAAGCPRRRQPPGRPLRSEPLPQGPVVEQVGRGHHGRSVAAMTIPLDPSVCAAIVGSPVWHVTANGDCLIWTGRVRDGYGQVWLPRDSHGVRSRALVHRIALVAVLGRDIGAGLQVGHLCHDRALLSEGCVSRESNPCSHRRCVNPEHLAEQTIRENALASGSIAGIAGRRTHCRFGHPYVGEIGSRVCHQCRRRRDDQSYQLAAEAAALLGMSSRRYIAEFGRSVSTARAVLASAAVGA